MAACLSQFVRPWVIDHGTEGREPARIEDVIESRLAQGLFGPLFLLGPRGSGRRTALEYVRLRFEGRGDVAVGARNGAPDARCVRLCAEAPGDALPRQRLELVPWSRDEWIEYLLARHPQCVASVMARLEHPEEELDLKGRALLWSAILDELARDPELPDASDALRRALRTRISTPENYARAAEACWQLLLRPLLESREIEDVVLRFRELSETEPEAAPFLAQSAVHVLLGAECLVGSLAEHKSPSDLPVRLAPEVLRAARGELRRRPVARTTLAALLASSRREVHASAASLLHLYGPGALIESVRALHPSVPRLAHAELGGLQAADADLRQIEIDGAHLRRACLDGAELNRANMRLADLTDGSLRGANLEGVSAGGVRLERADLRGAKLDGAELRGANLDEAHLEDASLRGARLEGASLQGACLDRANLSAALLRTARLAGASFVDSDLSGAILDGIDLRNSRLATPQLKGASLVGCNLEGLELDAPDLSGADLADALLTGSRLKRADLTHARLVGAGLAGIEWEHANLFQADLSHASFHLGSTRSGLSLGTPASWGTQTGFYTNELRDQGFKPPEQIRKANLRHADLRGAKIFSTDFYLVDLRDALYTPDQEKHLRACGALLGR